MQAIRRFDLFPQGPESCTLLLSDNKTTIDVPYGECTCMCMRMCVCVYIYIYASIFVCVYACMYNSEICTLLLSDNKTTSDVPYGECTCMCMCMHICMCV